MKRLPLLAKMLSIFVLVATGCQVLPQQAPPTQTPLIITVVVPATAVPPTPLVATTTLPATPVPAALPSATAGPQCVVQQNLNLRKGPGTAYTPPITSLETGVILIPQGFSPQGFPGGSWVQVLDPKSNLIGWVSAGSQFVACNLDVTLLPVVAVPSPPPPPAPMVSNSQVEGEPGNMVAKVTFSPIYLMQIAVQQKGMANNGDGVAAVVFNISYNGAAVYSHRETTVKYCIFGGGEPYCNPWPLTNGVYTWGQGGQPVKSGSYDVVISAEPKGGTPTPDPDGQINMPRWFFTIDVNLTQSGQ
jgi:hypothetical protein